LALEAADVTAERGLSHGTLRPGRYVRLSVEDSGSGMDEATLSHIFEPFFTTKDIGRGTGLGLSLVYAISPTRGGAIDVKERAQSGQHVYDLPDAGGRRARFSNDIAGPPPRGNGERVLLVEDEAPLLAGTAEVLSQLGYEPVAFSDSRAALAAFERPPVGLTSSSPMKSCPVSPNRARKRGAPPPPPPAIVLRERLQRAAPDAAGAGRRRQ